MIDKWIHICKIHWREILTLSIVWHFIFDWIILGVGILIGYHIGHTHG